RVGAAQPEHAGGGDERALDERQVREEQRLVVVALRHGLGSLQGGRWGGARHHASEAGCSKRAKPNVRVPPSACAATCAAPTPVPSLACPCPPPSPASIASTAATPAPCRSIS